MFVAYVEVLEEQEAKVLSGIHALTALASAVTVVLLVERTFKFPVPVEPHKATMLPVVEVYVSDLVAVEVPTSVAALVTTLKVIIHAADTVSNLVRLNFIEFTPLLN